LTSSSLWGWIIASIFFISLTLPFLRVNYNDAPEPHPVQTKPLDWLDQKYLLDVSANSP
jgi:hypothetical protein